MTTKRSRPGDQPAATPKPDRKKDKDNRAKIAGVLPIDSSAPKPKAKRPRLPSDGPPKPEPKAEKTERLPQETTHQDQPQKTSKMKAKLPPEMDGSVDNDAATVKQAAGKKTLRVKTGDNPLVPGEGAPSYQDEVMDAYGIPDPEDVEEVGDPGRTEKKLDRAASMLLSRMKSKLSGKDAILGPSSAMIHMLIDEVADELEINHVDVIRAFSAEHYHDPVMYFQINMSGVVHNDAEMLDNHKDNLKFADEVKAVHDDIWEGFSRSEMRDLLAAKQTEHRRCLEANEAVYRATGTIQALEEDIRSLKLCLNETTCAGSVATANGGLASLSDYEGEYPYYTPKKKKKKLAKQPVIKRVTNEMVAAEPHWIVRNPDREALASLLEDSRGRLSGLLDQDLFVWPAAASSHSEVVARHALDGTEIEIRENRVILTGGLLVEAQEPLANWVARHAAIRRLFGRGFKVGVRSFG